MSVCKWKMCQWKWENVDGRVYIESKKECRGSTHELAIVGPATKLHVARLHIKRKVLDVHLAGRLINCRWFPTYFSRIIKQSFGHNCNLVVPIRTVNSINLSNREGRMSSEYATLSCYKARCQDAKCAQSEHEVFPHRRIHQDSMSVCSLSCPFLWRKFKSHKKAGWAWGQHHKFHSFLPDSSSTWDG